MRLNKSSVAIAAAAVIWLCATIFVMILLNGYSITPGEAGSPPEQWPVDSQIRPSPGKPTLLLFLHPRCPCSRATLGELEVLLAQCQGLANTIVLFTKPSGVSAEWADTDLWRRASKVAGMTAMSDPSGIEARRFRSETSGEVLLYSSDGRLLFQGGITASRGHSGDNPGRSALTTSLRGNQSNQNETSVFGCPLFEESCQNNFMKANYE
jgi:hypothetical protein